ncbi:transcription antitermination factor NusB [Radiobacillus sp. PE A8.2]|uniref:transcription antitermination factor NusB n=1 Tax=Radiobacillus sp. PE A8.2 TaxID=3380349 RepID=UPI00388FDE08
MKRRTAREKAFQILFQMDVNDIAPQEAIEHVLEEEAIDAFLSELVYGVNKNKQAIDEKITANLEKWTLERLATVEKTVLRIAAFELMFESETPQGVVINEAVELAKLYGDDKSGKFVNGVLSKVIS